MPPSTRPLWQRFLIFLLPLMLANILQSLSGTINNIFIGQLIGVEALAAASVFFPILFFLMSFVIGLSSTDQTSPDLELPSWIVYLCIPLGSYLMCFRFLQVAWTYWRTGELPHHDHSHVEGIEIDDAVGPTPEGSR